MAVDQGHDMWVLKAHEDIDLGRKVFLELFIELRQVHGLDSYIGFRFLCGRTRLAFITPHITKKGMTHCMNTLIDRRKTTSPDLIEPRIATDGHFWTGGLA